MDDEKLIEAKSRFFYQLSSLTQVMGVEEGFKEAASNSSILSLKKSSILAEKGTSLKKAITSINDKKIKSILLTGITLSDEKAAELFKAAAEYYSMKAEIVKEGKSLTLIPFLTVKAGLVLNPLILGMLLKSFKSLEVLAGDTFFKSISSVNYLYLCTTGLLFSLFLSKKPVKSILLTVPLSTFLFWLVSSI